MGNRRARLYAVFVRRALFAPACLWIGCALAFPSTSSASPVAVRIESVGTCPSAREVEEQARPLLRRHVVESGDAPGRGRVAEILDEGDSYVIRVAGLSREIRDAARDCSERAQVAALVLALTLEPATAGERAAEKQAADRHRTKKHGTTEGALPSTLSESEGASPVDQGETAPQQDVDGEGWAVAIGAKAVTSFEEYRPSVGPSIGLNLLANHWLFSLSGSLFPAQRIELAGATATISRYALDLTTGPAFHVSSWHFQAVLGAAFDPFLISSEEFETRQVRLDVGPAAAVSLAYDGWRVQPFLMLDARWFPHDYELLIDPRGEVGRTPQLYLGATTGIRIDQL